MNRSVSSLAIIQPVEPAAQIGVPGRFSTTVAHHLQASGNKVPDLNPIDKQPKIDFMSTAADFPLESLSHPEKLVLLQRLQQELSRRPDSADRERFNKLAQQWKAETAHLSSTTALAMHNAYQQIVGMGITALPMLLEEMRDRPHHWTWALRAITGVDPVPKQSRGKLQEMGAAWIAWGRSNGYQL